MSENALNKEKAQFRAFLAKVEELAQRTGGAIDRTESLMNDAARSAGSRSGRAGKDGPYHWHNRLQTPDSAPDRQNAPDKRGPHGEGA